MVDRIVQPFRIPFQRWQNKFLKHFVTNHIAEVALQNIGGRWAENNRPVRPSHASAFRMEDLGEVVVCRIPGRFDFADETQDLLRFVDEIHQEVFRPAQRRRHIHHASEIGHADGHDAVPPIHACLVDGLDPFYPFVLRIVNRVDVVYFAFLVR